MRKLIVAVMVSVSVEGPYSYRVPKGMQVGRGSIVAVPLIGRTTLGVVWGVPQDNFAHNRLKDIERVFEVLLDPAALARVIPGCHGLQADGPNRYRADVTVGVGLIKARYEARITLSDIEAPHRLRLAGRGSSSLGTGAGDGLVRLSVGLEDAGDLIADLRQALAQA